MAKYAIFNLLILLFGLGTLLPSLACRSCPPVTLAPLKPPVASPLKPPMNPPIQPLSPPPPPPQPTVIKSPPPPRPPPVPSPPPPPNQQTCPIDTLKLGACVNVLGGLVHIGLGNDAKDACCPVLQGLLDVEAAVCLCLAINAGPHDINATLGIVVQALAGCGKTPPPGFTCPA
ncbi:36.4 kDa proline-rich protein-like [Hevea brasiliensis]|uniref:36.4 kDa proline-rich protein-like n=1 Tax=Hevea brasiliensis TaxID=3981 RepID=UPI0025E33115|nr:36.4 kDa proline-rich protein-like [Hevea brasiliensis]